MRLVSPGGASQTLSLTTLGAGDVVDRPYAVRSEAGEEMVLTNNFNKSFRLALEGGGDHNSFGVPSDIPISQDVDIAFLDFNMGDIDGAIAIYERLYAQNSSSVVIANNLASLLATWKSADPQAVTRASAVARRLKDTQVPAFMDTYGWIQHLNGDSQAALPYLEGAAAGLAEDPIVQLHLGVVQAAVGKTETAKAQLQKGLDMLPEGQDGPSITAARETLARLNAPAAPEAGQDGATQDGSSGDQAAAPAAEQVNN